VLDSRSRRSTRSKASGRSFYLSISSNLAGTERGYLDRTYLRPPDPHHLSQGDVIAGVPLIVAPPRVILLDDIEASPESIRARRVTSIAESTFALVQVERVDAIILTYSCDIDRGLENIVRDTGPDPVELVTVTAVRQIDDAVRPKLNDIYRGRMPRFAAIPATTWHSEMLIDFSAIQQISLRVLVPLAFERRLCATAQYGQIRLLERMAHALGDQVRHNAADGVDAPDLFGKAHAVLTRDLS
jgi:hypothetical protein